MILRTDHNDTRVETLATGELASTPVPTTPQSQQGHPLQRQQKLRKMSVLIPVYNERWTIEKIVQRVKESPLSLDLEIVLVDDGSQDGSWEVIRALAEADDRIQAVRHAHNQGKGAAVRTAMKYMTGDVAVIQDADFDYNPMEFQRLLSPILEGHADAVYGSRFAGHPRRVLLFWHSLANRGLTLLSNMLNDLNLTDMETCYKMVRADILRQLRLSSKTFTFEPELTCRLAQWGARIYEVPISYSGRTFQEGKKIRAIDGVKALWEMIRCRFLDTQFTYHTGMCVLKSVAHATRYHQWIVKRCQTFLGQRVLEAGAGIGNLSTAFLNRQRAVLLDHDPVYVARLKDRFGQRGNVHAVSCDLTNREELSRLKTELLDTIFCSNVLEHLEPDEQVLKSFFELLVPGGHCVIVVPAGPKLYTRLDTALGHFRRYTPAELQHKMQDAGFEVVHTERFCRFGALAWWINGNVLRRHHLSPRQMIYFDRLWPITKHLDRVLPFPGMSLLMVGRRTD